MITEAQLKSWVDAKRLNSSKLCSNTHAIGYLSSNWNLIDWAILSRNPSAISLLLTNRNMIARDEFYANSAAMPYLDLNPNTINWKWLSMNSAAVDLLVANPNKIHWYEFSGNSGAVEYLKSNLDKIHWDNLSSNPSAIALLLENPTRINWKYLSSNPAAIDMLINNYSKIDWEYLCMNPNPKAIQLLLSNRNRINWDLISCNPNIFEIDGAVLNERFVALKCDNSDSILDLKVYHKNSQYLIDTYSLAMSIMCNIAIHNIYPGLYERNKEMKDKTLQKINQTIVKCLTPNSENIVVNDYGVCSMVMAIDVAKIKTTLVDIISKSANEGLILDAGETMNSPKYWLYFLNQYIDSIVSSTSQYLSYYDFMRNITDSDSVRDNNKAIYSRPRNFLNKDSHSSLRCYVCSCSLSLYHPNTHRAHNIPKSLGGSWSKLNIFLCCHECDTDMSNIFTVEEYSIERLRSQNPKWLLF